MADSLKQDEQLISDGNRHILYDASLIEHPDVDLFDIAKAKINASDHSLAQGRAHAVFFQHQGHELVLKHYQRGGKMAALLGDKYIGSNHNKSRSFREWRLLSQMQNTGLPSPVPVAASVTQSGLFYRADLITQKISHVVTLADYLQEDKLDDTGWKEAGACIRKFHDANVYHADLNSRNIMFNPETYAVYLIDFDKGCIRHMGDAWKAANLARLQRSLLKFKSMYERFNYSQAEWDRLLEGYRG